jgi:hypothetical protein
LIALRGIRTFGFETWVAHSREAFEVSGIGRFGGEAEAGLAAQKERAPLSFQYMGIIVRL